MKHLFILYLLCLANIVVGQNSSALFPGCNEEKTDLEQKRCSKEKLLLFIYKNLEYPDDAYNNDIEGTVAVRYTVNTKGVIEDVKVITTQGSPELGYGLEEEAVFLVEEMNYLEKKWTPAMKDGEPVLGVYVIPIKFSLRK